MGVLVEVGAGEIVYVRSSDFEGGDQGSEQLGAVFRSLRVRPRKGVAGAPRKGDVRRTRRPLTSSPVIEAEHGSKLWRRGYRSVWHGKLDPIRHLNPNRRRQSCPASCAALWANSFLLCGVLFSFPSAARRRRDRLGDSTTFGSWRTPAFTDRAEALQ
jgi:hypothetical protein